jgi:2-polyprenyl-3-methyl-5-hydroxy-6-metoxy-1,4-benzoquinol methylase
MSEEVQRRLWGDLAKVREQFEDLIQTELRVVRQRVAAAAFRPAAGAAAQQAVPAFDYAMLAERFRGPEEHVREGQRAYVPLFEKGKSVLDIGCGRGEFLELMKEAGVVARGIDISPESVAGCRAKGLEAEAADAFAFLPGLEDESLDGIFCAHLVEHLDPARLPELIRLAAAKLIRGGLIAIETPNPECLAALACYFYLDPTHQRPLPAALLRFYLEEAGFGRIEVRRLSPAVASMPSLKELPEGFRAAFFDGLDYAIIGRKL